MLPPSDMEKTDKPLVSVMLVTYNQEKFVAAAIESAVTQDYENLEVVVGDDGSTDRTFEIIQEYALKYPNRVKVIEDRSHLGISGNCSRNLKHCQGTYIAFSAGDDVYLPGKVTKQVGWFEADARRVLCGHDSEFFASETGQRLFLYSQMQPMRSGRGVDFDLGGGSFDALSIMVRRSAIPAQGFDARIHRSSDLKMWIDCLANGGDYGFIPEILTRHRVHDRNVTHDELAGQEDMVRFYRAVASDYSQFRDESLQKMKTLVALLVTTHFARGDRAKTREYMSESIKLHGIRTLKRALVYALCYLPDSLFARLAATCVRVGWASRPPEAKSYLAQNIERFGPCSTHQ